MKYIAIIFIIIALAIAGVFSFNYFTVTQPVHTAINEDNKKDNIKFSTHYKNYVQPGILVFNIKEISVSTSRADVFRIFLKTAQALKERSFDKVELCSKGIQKFSIDGSYFKELGEEYGDQNPIYTVRTFPEHVYNPDGTKAFDEWTGGILGVLKEQMEDFNDFSDKWYGEDL